MQVPSYAAVFSLLLAFLSEDLCAQSDIWSTKTPMPTARVSPASAVVGDQLYVIGGFTDLDGSFSVVEVYDPATDSWSGKTSMPTSRGRLALAVIDETIYAIGGNEGESAVEAYDPLTNTWSSKASLTAGRLAPAAGTINGKLYVAGGTFSPDSLQTLEVYDPATSTWTLKAPMPTPRFLLAAGVIDGKLYTVGGTNSVHGGPSLAVLEVYDPVSDTWATKEPMLTPRSDLAAAVIDGKLYVVGGFSAESTTGSELEVYDPISDHWSTISLMPTPRGGLAASALGGKLYTTGGTFLPGDTPHATLEQYTIAAVVSVKDDYPTNAANVFTLYANFPNPFNPVTEIRFQLPKASHVDLTIYNTIGQVIRRLSSQSYAGGEHALKWDGRNQSGHSVSSGVYLYELQIGAFRQVKKMSLLR